MPVRPRLRPHTHAELTFEQEFELLIGPSYQSAFSSEPERRRAWKAHRTRLVARDRYVGRRPWGFWQYDYLGDPPPAGWAEAAALIAAGVVDDEEVAAIYREWSHWDSIAWLRSSGDLRRYRAERQSFGIPDYFPGRGGPLGLAR